MKDNKKRRKFTLLVGKPYLLGFIFFNIIKIFNSLVEIFLLADLVDSIVSYFKDNSQIKINYIIAIIAIWLLNAISETGANYFKKMYVAHADVAFTKAIVYKKSRLPYPSRENKDVQKLIERIESNSAEKCGSYITSFMTLSSLALRALGLAIIVGMENPVMGIVTLVCMIPLCVMSVKFGNENYDAFSDASEDFRYANEIRKMISSRDNALERKIFDFSDWLNSKWRKVYETGIQKEKAVQKNIYRKMAYINIAYVLFLGIVMILLLFNVTGGAVTVGFYIALIKAIMNYLDTMIVDFSPALMEFIKDRMYLKDLYAFFALSELKEHDNHQFGELSNIEFKNVTFRYPGTEKNILNNFTCKLDGKKKYALVGMNGAGKSTLIKLLLGIYEDYSGEILINGVEVRELSEEDKRNYFSIAFQDYAKYPISLKDNLDFIDDEKNNQILSNTGITDIMVKKNIAMDTFLGKLDEEATDLSGGEWQSVTVARTIMKNALIYILDEPTASIDPIKEAEIYDTFSKDLREKFVIFITHRLGAIKNVDEIIVLKNGSVSEQGNHLTLINNKDDYYKMYEEQRQWYS